MIFLLVLIIVMDRLPVDPLSAAANWVFDRLFLFAEFGFNIVRLFV